MYTCQVKYLKGTKWFGVPMQELLGDSIISYMAKTKDKTIAALMDDGKPQVFVSNDNELVEKYKAQGVSMHVDDMLKLMASKASPPVALAVEVFEGGEFRAYEMDKPKEKDKKNMVVKKERA